MDNDQPLARCLNSTTPCSTLDFTVKDMVNENGDWNWDLLSSLPSSVCLRLVAIPTPRPFNRTDRLVWSGNINGSFYVSSAYNLLRDHDQLDPLWKRIWLLSHDNICPRCHLLAEDTLHVLRDCDFMAQVWRHLIHARHWPIFFSFQLKDWLLFNLSKKIGVTNESIWSLWFGITCWYAWHWQNKLVFTTETGERPGPIEAIQKYVLEVHHSELARQRMNLGQEKCTPGLIGWQCPHQGWIKVNIDGAFRANTGLASAGGLLWDTMGKWIGGF